MKIKPTAGKQFVNRLQTIYKLFANDWEIKFEFDKFGFDGFGFGFEFDKFGFDGFGFGFEFDKFGFDGFGFEFEFEFGEFGLVWDCKSFSNHQTPKGVLQSCKPPNRFANSSVTSQLTRSLSFSVFLTLQQHHLGWVKQFTFWGRKHSFFSWLAILFLLVLTFIFFLRSRY